MQWARIRGEKIIFENMSFEISILEDTAHLVSKSILDGGDEDSYLDRTSRVSTNRLLLLLVVVSQS